MYTKLYTFLAIAVFIPLPKLHCLNLKEFLVKRNAKITPLTYTTRHKQTHFDEALGLGISLGLATHYALAQDDKEQENSQEKAHFSIKDLNIKNPHAVLEGFAKATEAEKRELAQHVAAGISWYKFTESTYSIQNISDFLAATTDTTHHILVTAIARSITRFKPKEIIILLSSDPQAETHELIAKALKDNYASFTGYSFCGIELSSDNHWRNEYASLLKGIKPEYQAEMLQPILKNIEKYNVFHLLYYADTQHKQTILKALKESNVIDLSLYSGTEIFHLLRLTKPFNQKIVAQAIAKDVGTYTSWHFHGLFELCTEESKKIILQEIAKHIKKDEKNYDMHTLSYIKEMALELPGQEDSTLILSVIEKRTAAPAR